MNSYAKSGVVRTSLTTIIVLLSIAVGVFIFGRYREMVSLGAPIGYLADASAMYGMRGIGDAGLPFADRMSAPFNHSLNRVPDDVQCYAFSMECSILRITGLFQHDPIKIVNIYYLLVYFICGLTALYALRRFGVGWLAAGAGAVLFALLPYHFMRNVNHLTLTNYSLIPLFMLVCAWIHDQHPGAGADVLPERLPWREAAFILLICLTWGLTNDYYAFMFLLFAWLAAFLSSTRNRSLRPMYVATSVTIGLMIAFGLRRALVHMSWGANAGISFGTFQLSGYGEDEQYPLKLIQMILPAPDNRMHALAHLNQVYSKAHPLVNENSYAVLGTVLAIAMLVLLAKSLFGRPDQSIRDRFLGKNLLFAILVGAMGGIGTIISEASWKVFGGRFPLSQARAWNRVYVFLAFVVVLFLATHVDRWLRGLGERKRIFGRIRFPHWLGVAVVVVVTCLAMLDQIPPLRHSWLVGNNRRYLVDKSFFGKLDQHYAGRYRVFYWPAMRPFVGFYAKAYYTVAYHPLIVSPNLITSYGGAPDTQAAKWLDATARQPPSQMLDTLCAAKFDGVLVFKRALRDQDASLVTYLQAHQAPLQDNKYYAYYSLAPVCRS
jgi:phosphoglycerol transferase